MRKPTFILALLILLAPWLRPGAPAAATAPQETTCAGQSCLYLPLIANYPHILLLGPGPGTTIGSLAPVLAWQAPVAGNYRIQVSEDSAFAPTSSFALSETKDIKLPLPTEIHTLITSNLKPRQTYYWRIEKTSKAGVLFTASEYFATSAKDARLLPVGVHLLAPANNSSVAAQNLWLTWQPISGALYYRIRLYDAQNALIDAAPAEVGGAVTSVSVPNLALGTRYHWKVKALNAYGWGDYSTEFYFTLH